jgi:hypothetical protein
MVYLWLHAVGSFDSQIIQAFGILSVVLAGTCVWLLRVQVVRATFMLGLLAVVAGILNSTVILSYRSTFAIEEILPPFVTAFAAFAASGLAMFLTSAFILPVMLSGLKIRLQMTSRFGVLIEFGSYPIIVVLISLLAGMLVIWRLLPESVLTGLLLGGAAGTVASTAVLRWRYGRGSSLEPLPEMSLARWHARRPPSLELPAAAPTEPVHLQPDLANFLNAAFSQLVRMLELTPLFDAEEQGSGRFFEIWLVPTLSEKCQLSFRADAVPVLLIRDRDATTLVEAMSRCLPYLPFEDRLRYKADAERAQPLHYELLHQLLRTPVCKKFFGKEIKAVRELISYQYRDSLSQAVVLRKNLKKFALMRKANSVTPATRLMAVEGLAYFQEQLREWLHGGSLEVHVGLV